MNNLETNESRAAYKEQENRIMMRSELSDSQKDAAIDALFDRYCAEYACYGSNTRTQTRLSSSSGSSSSGGTVSPGLVLWVISFGVGWALWSYRYEILSLLQMFLNTPK